jgi:hypothetical protein
MRGARRQVPLACQCRSLHLKQKGAITGPFLQYAGQSHVSSVTIGELFTWEPAKVSEKAPVKTGKE